MLPPDKGGEMGGDRRALNRRMADVSQMFEHHSGYFGNSGMQLMSTEEGRATIRLLQS